jgi:hypothetical protein
LLLNPKPPQKNKKLKQQPHHPVTGRSSKLWSFD